MAFATLPITEVDSHRKTVTTNGLEYSYLEYGASDNPPVILLHGIWSTGAVWHDIAMALSETHHVRSVDFRGRSQTEWSPEGDYSTEAYVSDVLGLYEALCLEKASVIGHSMGGGVATALAAAHPDLVESLVVIDSGPVMRAGSASSNASWRRYLRIPRVWPQRVPGRPMPYRTFRATRSNGVWMHALLSGTDGWPGAKIHESEHPGI